MLDMTYRIKPIEMMDADQIAIHVRCGDITMAQAEVIHHPNRIRAAKRRIADVEQIEEDHRNAPCISTKEMLDMVMR